MYTGANVNRVEFQKNENTVDVTEANGTTSVLRTFIDFVYFTETYDNIVFACPPDVALKMISAPTWLHVSLDSFLFEEELTHRICCCPMCPIRRPRQRLRRALSIMTLLFCLRNTERSCYRATPITLIFPMTKVRRSSVLCSLKAKLSLKIPFYCLPGCRLYRGVLL